MSQAVQGNSIAEKILLTHTLIYLDIDSKLKSFFCIDMKNTILFILASLSVISSGFFYSSCSSSTAYELSENELNKKSAAVTNEDPGFIYEQKQISIVGPRSGEAYFSPDGSKIIFQSERYDGNPFYQIYQMDLASGKTELLSTGKGKTTCSWFHPSMKKALFSSSHTDPKWKSTLQTELDARKNPVQGRYSWSFDPYFDVYEVDLKTKKLKALTHQMGYDAEGSYSPDGKKILFASNRTGYLEKLEGDDLKLFEKDPSSQMELYSMDADGKNVKRLTHALGYDGGPFYNFDGSKITWRRFNRLGTSAEIWVMDADGKNQKQITQLNSMSWAPFFHPSGDYIVFTTNKLGYQNFELYIVDTEGKNQPIRVSFLEDFDGLPVFSPDGSKIVWSHKDSKGESQLLMAQWDDLKARKALGLNQALPRPDMLSLNPSELDAKKIVYYFADKSFQGRLVGSKEEAKMSEELAQWFQALGLNPYFKNGYQQSFSFTSEVKVGDKSEFSIFRKSQTVESHELGNLNKDFKPFPYSAKGPFDRAKIAFAGYGLVIPASETQTSYNSYQDLDVKNKWVIVLNDIPSDISNSKRIYFNQFSRLHHKALVAKQQGALGLLVVSEKPLSKQGQSKDLKFDGASATASLPLISVSSELAQKLLSPSKINLLEWKKVLDQGDLRGASELAEYELKIAVELIEKSSTGYNTIATLKMPNAKSTLLIGAHGDHLGLGQTGTSLSRGDLADAVHYGADDNASGMAVVLMLAKHFKTLKDQGLKLPFNLAFAIWSGEEVGLLGSSAFVKSNTQPLFAYINYDMVGRLRDSLTIQGLASAHEWKSYLEPLVVSADIRLQFQDDPYLPTDSMSFYLSQIPAISFFTGAHLEYHTPLDQAHTLNFNGIQKIADFSVKAVKQLADKNNKPIKLSYNKVEGAGKTSGSSGRKFRVFLGTIPDYVQEKVKGVKISGTSKNSPAEKAGLKAGDVITQIDTVLIENLYDYVYVLQGLKPNVPVKMSVLRGTSSVNLNVTPLLRE